MLQVSMLRTGVAWALAVVRVYMYRVVHVL